MPDHNYHDEDLFNPETRHEQSDIPIRPFWWAAIIFIVFSLLTWIVITFFFRGLATLERSQAEGPQSGIARPASADVPQNQPLLQPFPRTDGAAGTPIAPTADTPVADLIKMRENEKQVLTSYGWVDRHQGKVHIPIDKAKEIMAARLALQGQAGVAAAAPAPGAQSTTVPAPASQTTTAPAPVAPATTTPAAAPTATPSGEGTAQ